MEGTIAKKVLKKLKTLKIAVPNRKNQAKQTPYFDTFRSYSLVFIGYFLILSGMRLK